MSLLDGVFSRRLSIAVVLLGLSGIVGGLIQAALGLVTSSFVQLAPGLAAIGIAGVAIAMVRSRTKVASILAIASSAIATAGLIIDPALIHGAGLVVAGTAFVGQLRHSTRILAVFISALGASYAIATGIAILMAIASDPMLGAIGYLALGIACASVFIVQSPSLANASRPNALPALCFLGVLTITAVLAHETRAGGLREAHRAANRSAALLVQSLNRALELRMRAVERVASLWQLNHPGEMVFWGTQANNLIRDFPGLTTIERVDSSGRLEWLIPYNPPPSQTAKLNTDTFRQNVIATQCAAGSAGLGPVLTMMNGHHGVLHVAPTKLADQQDGAILGLIDLLATSDLVLNHVGAPREAITIFFGTQVIQERRQQGRLAEYAAQLQSSRFGAEVTPTSSSLPASATVLPLAILIVGVTMALKLALIVRFALIARDTLSELQVANSLVLAEQKQLRSAIDVARLGVWQLSADGGLATVDNRSAQILGFNTEAETLQIDLMERIELGTQDRDNLVDHLERGDSISQEVRVKTPNGVSKLVGLYGQPTKDGAGAVLGFTGVIADLDEQRATELELAESNAKFQAMLESAPLGIFLTRPDGTCYYTNPAYDGITGLPPAASRGYSCLLGIHSDDRGRVASEWAGAVSTLRHFSTNLRFSWVDGTIRECAVHASPVWGGGTETVGYIGFLEDVTEQRRAQEELKRARDRTEVLLNSTNAVVHSLKPYSAFCPTFVTPNVAEIFGLEPNDLLNTDGYLLERIHPDDRGAFEALNEQVIRSGTATIEYRVLDGSESYRWVRDSRNLILDIDQRPIEIAGYWIDITPQRQAEEKLREKSAVNEAMLETANYGILTALPDGTISSVNPAVSSILGFGPGDLVGVRTLDSLYLREELEICAEQATRVLDTPHDPGFRALVAMVDSGVADVDSWTLVGRDGKHVPVTVSLSRIVLADGSPIGYMAILQDDTERRLYQTQIDHQMTQLSEARLMLEEQQFELHSKNLELERLATTDGLTSLLNRRALMDRLRQAIAQADRQGHTVSVLMMDVDHFKSYNDSFGHPAGDDVLRRVAEIIRETVRGCDVAGRYGGEEFLVILPETTTSGAFMLAERIRHAIESFEWPNRQVTASFGVCTRHADESDEALLMLADEALYESKGGGRNRVTAWKPKAA